MRERKRFWLKKKNCPASFFLLRFSFLQRIFFSASKNFSLLLLWEQVAALCYVVWVRVPLIICTACNALFEPQVPNFSCPKHVRWDTRLMPSPSVWIWWGLKFVYYWVWTYYLSCIEIVVQTTKMTNIKIASETKCTVVVVGDSRTGKSALLQRFSQKTFQPVSF